MTVLKTFVEFSNACSVVVYYLQMSHFLFCLNIQITTFKIGSRRCSKDSMVFFKEKLARFFQTHPLRVKKKKKPQVLVVSWDLISVSLFRKKEKKNANSGSFLHCTGLVGQLVMPRTSLTIIWHTSFLHISFPTNHNLSSRLSQVLQPWFAAHPKSLEVIEQLFNGDCLVTVDYGFPQKKRRKIKKKCSEIS